MYICIRVRASMCCLSYVTYSRGQCTRGAAEGGRDHRADDGAVGEGGRRRPTGCFAFALVCIADSRNAPTSRHAVIVSSRRYVVNLQRSLNVQFELFSSARPTTRKSAAAFALCRARILQISRYRPRRLSRAKCRISKIDVFRVIFSDYI